MGKAHLLDRRSRPRSPASVCIRRTLPAVLLLLFLCAPPPAAWGSAYSPPGLYDVEQVRFPNGFLVLLKQRTQTRSVSLRLVVRQGTRHFPCDRRETPHLLEHVLLSGTARHSEEEMERFIDERGGTWNAVAGPEETTYQVDIFDGYADSGLTSLYEIIADSRISPETTERVKNIVYREEGGRPTALRRALYRLNIGKAAWKKANEWLLPGEGAVCPGLVDLERITVDDVRGAFRSAYVPGNMVLVVVGNFERSKMLAQVRATFGSMEPGPVPALQLRTPPPPTGKSPVVTGTFAPVLGTGGSAGLAYRTGGSDSPDAAALTVLSVHLHGRLYEQVRIQRGLSYAPEVNVFRRPDYGIFYLSADTSIRNVDRVAGLMEQAVAQVRRSPPNADEVERTKRQVLLSRAQGYVLNADAADLYAGSIPDILRLGRFRDRESEIEAVTADDVARAAARYLRSENRVLLRSIPTITYTGLYLAMGGAGIAAVIILLVLRRRATLRKARERPTYLRR